MKEKPLPLTETQAKQLLRYCQVAEDHKIESGNRKLFWKRHEVIIDKLQGIIYQFNPPNPRGRKSQ